MAEGIRRISPYVYGMNNPVRFIDPDGMEVSSPEVSEDANAITYKGEAAKEVLGMLQSRFSESKDPESDAKEMIGRGDFQGALNTIYDNTPLLRNFLSNAPNNKHLEIIPGSEKNMRKSRNSETEKVSDDNGHTWYALVKIRQSFLQSFARGENEYNYVIQTIFHELVHGKQLLGLDKFSWKNEAESEFEAYLYEAKNENIQISEYHRSYDYGWFPIRYLLNSGNGAALINEHCDEIYYLLSRVSPQTATNMKKEIFEQTKIKF